MILHQYILQEFILYADCCWSNSVNIMNIDKVKFCLKSTICLFDSKKLIIFGFQKTKRKNDCKILLWHILHAMQNNNNNNSSSNSNESFKAISVDSTQSQVLFITTFFPEFFLLSGKAFNSNFFLVYRNLYMRKHF